MPLQCRNLGDSLFSRDCVLETFGHWYINTAFSLFVLKLHHMSLCGLHNSSCGSGRLGSLYLPASSDSAVMTSPVQVLCVGRAMGRAHSQKWGHWVGFLDTSLTLLAWHFMLVIRPPCTGRSRMAFGLSCFHLGLCEGSALYSTHGLF